jgi:thiol-disulfide isomerase/thioredoxin
MNDKPPAQAEQKHPVKSGLVVVALVALVGTSIAYLGIKKAQPRTGIQKGDAAPTFKLSRYGGGTISLDELRDKVVMLNFWATWCVPCAVEMPALTKLAREYESKGMVFLAANQDEPESAQEQVRLFVAQIAPNLGRSIVFADEQMTIKYAVEELPTTFFIGRDGRILESYVGYVSESLVRQKIESALGK